jgi:hypothetical protein
MARSSTSRRAARPLAITAIAALVFLAGMAARSALRTDEAAGTQAPDAAAAEQGQRSRVEGGDYTVAGFERSRTGAQEAAVAYTTTLAQRLLYLDPPQAEAAVRAVAAAAASDALASKTASDLASVRDPLARGTGTTWWVVQPLAVKVEAYARDRARISVWLVRVLSRTGVVVPQSSWITESVDLVWERGDWRLWSSTTKPGPSPVLDGSDMPASSVALDTDLTGFELLDRSLSQR